jgi:hypothetical protein
MEVVPLSVGRISRAWDEQGLDTAAAAAQIGSASSGGFTSSVAGAASRFTTAWERHVTGLSEEAEARADGLRAVIADYLATDQAAGAHLLVLASYLRDPA